MTDTIWVVERQLRDGTWEPEVTEYDDGETLEVWAYPTRKEARSMASHVRIHKTRVRKYVREQR